MKKPKVVKDLPEPVRRPYDHDALASLMLEHPGEWVRLDAGPVNRMQALAAKWRNAPPLPYRSGGFEFRAISSGYGSGKAKLFGRATTAESEATE